MPVTDQSQND